MLCTNVFMNFVKKFFIKKNKRWGRNFKKDKNLIIISIESFYWALGASKLILLFGKVGLKIDVKVLLKTRS